MFRCFQNILRVCGKEMENIRQDLVALIENFVHLIDRYKYKYITRTFWLHYELSILFYMLA